MGFPKVNIIDQKVPKNVSNQVKIPNFLVMLGITNMPKMCFNGKNIFPNFLSIKKFPKFCINANKVPKDT